MKRDYRLSTYAGRDIDEIFDYTLENWGDVQFRRYHKLLSDALKSLCDDPEPVLSTSREELFAGCWSLNVGRHVILYRVTETRVEVARILHQSMELERHIPKEPYSED